MEHSTIPLGWLYLPVAFVLGALHAMEPGHGKSLASAYLVAGKHTWKDAIVLGLATTFSHTAVVILLAVASLAFKNFFSQMQLERGVTAAGALLLVGVGLWVAIRAAMTLRHGHEHGHHGHGHSHGDHGHAGSLWAVAAIGISNGALPCPGALAALLVAISLGQVALGLVTVLTYSLGLALALAVVGILVVEAGRRAQKWLPSEKAMLWLPLISGMLVMGTGIFLLATRI